MDIEYNEIGNKQIIDIRDRYKYIEKNIPKSINIKENELMLLPERYLNKKEEYVVYCDNGYRSKIVSNYLNTLGYKVYSLTGGINLYLKKH